MVTISVTSVTGGVINIGPYNINNSLSMNNQQYMDLRDTYQDSLIRLIDEGIIVVTNDATVLTRNDILNPFLLADNDAGNTAAVLSDGTNTSTAAQVKAARTETTSSSVNGATIIVDNISTITVVAGRITAIVMKEGN